MKNFINKFLIIIGSIVVVSSVVYAAGVTITSFTQTINDGDTMSTTWFNAVNGKLKGTYSDGKWCTAGSGGTIQCVNDAPTGSVPSGAVMAFNLVSCPTGWIAADGTNSTPDLRGTFIRGIGGDINSRDIARTLGNYQDDSLQGHTHSKTGWNVQYSAVGAGGLGHVGGGSNESYTNLSNFKEYTSDGTNGTPRVGAETRPKNIALLYCVKQ